MKNRFKRTALFLLALLVFLLLTGCGDLPAVVAEQQSAQQTAQPSAQQTALSADSDFRITCLDVGQADSALVECDGHFLLIDGGNAGDSNLVYSVLKKNGVETLDCLVCTHAHEDHVGGLPGALSACKTKLAWCPVTEYNSKIFQKFIDKLADQGVSVTVPAPGDTLQLGSARVEVLGPVRQYEDTNNTSIVLKITYGETTFLFTGDQEYDAEKDLLDSGADVSADVLKVGHHGSETSTCYSFLQAVSPQYAVISVGEDNTYGHPGADTLSRLRDAQVQVLRTDLQGDIVCTSDGKTVTVTAARNGDADTLGVGENSTAQPQTTYVLNTGTMKFHRPDCAKADSIQEKNKEIFTGDRADLIAQGYSPCGNCKP